MQDPVSSDDTTNQAEARIEDYWRRDFIRWDNLASDDICFALRQFAEKCRVERQSQSWSEAFGIDLSSGVKRLHTIAHLLAGKARVPPPPAISGDLIAFVFLLQTWAEESSMLASDLHRRLVSDPHILFNSILQEIEGELRSKSRSKDPVNLDSSQVATRLKIACFRGQANYARKALVDLNLPRVPPKIDDVRGELKSFKTWYTIAIARLESTPIEAHEMTQHQVPSDPKSPQTALNGNGDNVESRTNLVVDQAPKSTRFGSDATPYAEGSTSGHDEEWRLVCEIVREGTAKKSIAYRIWAKLPEARKGHEYGHNDGRQVVHFPSFMIELRKVRPRHESRR